MTSLPFPAPRINAVPCIEVLPATKSSPHNSITWTPGELPGEGTLVVDTKRSRSLYAVREFLTAWVGRAFRLEVLRGGTDAEAESYDVFAAADPRRSNCDCKGFTRHGHCKHVAAVLALLDNRWI